ncbi:MAG: MATE family efflux transporter [Gluconacetobacter diazotrophicus]|nr:MATE family efflux transporter [Gluconacetobacter diazotrophicus]
MDGTIADTAAAARAGTVAGHARALLALTLPLAATSLSEMAMGLTDTVLLGGIGTDALAAGSLGGTLFFVSGASLQGIVGASGVLIAQARGAGRPERIPALYGTAILLGLLLAVPVFVLASLAEPLLLRLGEPPRLAHDIGIYLGILRWGAFPFLSGLGAMRAVLPAIDQAGLLLRVTPLMAVANGLLNWALIHGLSFGGHRLLPPLGLRGSALATTLTLFVVPVVLFALLHADPRRGVLVRSPRIGRAELGHTWRLGAPIGLTVAAEAFLFAVAGLAAGTMGADALAAHQIALNIGAFTFMVPMALGQAANVRTGLATGARDATALRRAGFTAMALAAAIMAAIGLALFLLPHLIVSAFLDPDSAADAGAFRLAVALLGIAALWQVVDGVQTTAIGALRGTGDTRVPMLLAQIGYWLIGFPLGILFGFVLHGGVVGLWIALATALASVAVMMTLRFRVVSRRPLRVVP